MLALSPRGGRTTARSLSSQLGIVGHRHLHRRGMIAEAVTLLRDMADAGPGEMIGEDRRPVRRQHVQHLDVRRHRLLGVGVVGVLGARPLGKQDGGGS